MTAAVLRKGWCPGVLRPMPSGDGFLVRLKLTAGELPAATATTIAALAAEHGNGGIDMTQRANLQLRGVREASLPELTRALDGLGLIDASPEAEAVRNVLVSPLAGFDPWCADGRKIARALEDLLRRDASLQRLPAKFGFGIDGGGLWPLGETGLDVTLCADYAGDEWRIRLAGSELLSKPSAASKAVSTLARLARHFAESALPRMRDLVARDGAQAVYSGAAVAADPTWKTTDRAAIRSGPGGLPLAAGIFIAAIGLPFGHIGADQLAGLVEACGRNTKLRLTPWRLLLVPVKNVASASKLLSVAARLGLITEPDDPRANLEACTGAPGCPNATTPTRQDALALAGLLAGKLHVSGCAKGCAHRRPAPITLVARDGRYDLVLKGLPSDAPVRTGIERGELVAALQPFAALT